jgi:plasmid maintenance system killer protein
LTDCVNVPIDICAEATHILGRMRIEFADPRLALIRTAQAHKLGLPIGVIKAAQRKLLVIEAASSELTLRNWKSLEYKKLEGSEERQIRINDQYRMRFKLNEETKPPTVIVTFIGDPH